jgi:hypothetical protein
VAKRRQGPGLPVGPSTDIRQPPVSTPRSVAPGLVCFGVQGAQSGPAQWKGRGLGWLQDPPVSGRGRGDGAGMPQWAAAREFEWYTLYMYEFVSSGNFELTLLTN